MKELEKTYNPADIEDRLYEKWLKGKYFHAEVNRSKKPFTIVMPPPNITGQLHMGHALDNTCLLYASRRRPICWRTRQLMSLFFPTAMCCCSRTPMATGTWT